MKTSLTSILLLFAVSLHAQTWDATYACPAGNTIGFVVTGATNEPVRWSWVGKIRVVTNATETVAASPTYLIKQNFEGAGYDNSESWVASYGPVVDPDSTVAALEGSQSLRVALTNSYGYTQASFATNSEAWGYLLLKPEAFPASSQPFAYILEGGGSVLMTIGAGSDGTVRLVCGSSTVYTTDKMSAGTTYSVWWHYKAGGGANAEASVEFAATPTQVGSGNKFVSLSNGSSTGSAAKLRLGLNNNTVTVIYNYDHVRVDDASIGSNPD